MAEKLTYCIRSGTRVYTKDARNRWQGAFAEKSLCGRLVRVTSIGGKGGVYNMMPAAIVKVRGFEVATHPKNIKLVGRG